MRKLVSLLICLIILFGCATAEQTVILPGGHYAVDVPDWMDYNDPVDGDAGVEAYISPDLEMDYISYTKEEAVYRGMADNLRQTAEDRKAQGADVQIRKVNGIEMLCYRLTDDADEAPCIGYVFEDGDRIIEIAFWYATQEAADKTKEIMETIREAESTSF